MADDEDGLWYPTVEDVLAIHEDIVAEDPDATPGAHDASRTEFVLDFVRGRIGEAPSTIHEKAFHLMRLIASNHWFADANKRTALNTAELFYLVSGYELDYGDDVRAMLKLFSVREDLIDRQTGPAYLRDRTEAWRFDEDDPKPADVFAFLVLPLVAAYSDRDAEELLSEADVDVDSVREEFGLTTAYGTTVNIDGQQGEDEYGG
jgi:death-on-curing protein